MSDILAALSGPAPKEQAGPKLTVDAGPDGGQFTGLVTTQPVQPGEYQGAFARVYELAGLNPDDYRIVDDTVRFSSWEQSAYDNTLKARSTITLYSYRAQFQRITPIDVRTEALVKELAKSFRVRRPRRTPGTGLGAPCSYAPLWADWQGGKNETRPGDPGETGVEQTTHRIDRAIEASIHRIKTLRKHGRNITGITNAFMGDPTEGVADSYVNQTHIIELDMVQQMHWALARMRDIAEALLPLADDEARMVFVLCNHGQLSRKGTKTNVTGDADNVQNHLAMLLRDYVVGPKMPGVEWVLPGEQMIVTPTISGVPVAASHGHKVTGGEDSWLLRQTALLAAQRGTAPRVWLTAHRHSQDVRDLGSIHRIQAATADGGSKHFTDGSGIYSTPGTTTLLIGNHNERGFSDVELL